MANLDAWIAKQTADFREADQNQLNALKSGYRANADAENARYGSDYEQAKRQLSQIPESYDGQRAAADQAKNQALSLLPGQLADSGAAADSGADYAARTNIGSNYQNAMDSIGQEQNGAVQKQQNTVNTLTAQHQANLAKLGNAYKDSLANALASQAKTILSQALTGYDAQESREQKAQKAAVKTAGHR